MAYEIFVIMLKRKNPDEMYYVDMNKCHNNRFFLSEKEAEEAMTEIQPGIRPNFTVMPIIVMTPHDYERI